MWGRVAQVGLVALATAVVSVANVQAGPLAVPDKLKVPPHNVQLLKMPATGVQIYVCKPRTDDPNAFAWTFKAPQAVLYNDLGEKVGTHYAGPTWEGNDGSKVVGEVLERVDAPAAGAIPWLLLVAKSHDGAGAFSTITYIQRLDTVGGVAPTSGCDRSTVDTERAVEYRATYVFYYVDAR
jgi:hypothetical protein